MKGSGLRFADPRVEEFVEDMAEALRTEFGARSSDEVMRALRADDERLRGLFAEDPELVLHGDPRNGRNYLPSDGDGHRGSTCASWIDNPPSLLASL